MNPARRSGIAASGSTAPASTSPFRLSTSSTPLYRGALDQHDPDAVPGRVLRAVVPRLAGREEGIAVVEAAVGAMEGSGRSGVGGMERRPQPRGILDGGGVAQSLSAEAQGRAPCVTRLSA